MASTGIKLEITNGNCNKAEAKIIGKKAIIFSNNNDSSFSVGIKERKHYKGSYKISIIKNDLKNIAGKTKYMPKNFVNKEQNNITSNFINYALPLIGKKIPILYWNNNNFVHNNLFINEI